MTDYRTPLARAKGFGSTHQGLAHWVHQRVTALALIPLSIGFLFELLRHTQSDYTTVIAWVAQPWVGSPLALLVGMVFYHSALGLQVIIEDYIPHPFWKTVFIMKVKLIHLAMAVLCWFFILRIAIVGSGYHS